MDAIYIELFSQKFKRKRKINGSSPIDTGAGINNNFHALLRLQTFGGKGSDELSTKPQLNIEMTAVRNSMLTIVVFNI